MDPARLEKIVSWPGRKTGIANSDAPEKSRRPRVTFRPKPVDFSGPSHSVSVLRLACAARFPGPYPPDPHGTRPPSRSSAFGGATDFLGPFQRPCGTLSNPRPFGRLLDQLTPLVSGRWAYHSAGKSQVKQKSKIHRVFHRCE